MKRIACLLLSFLMVITLISFTSCEQSNNEENTSDETHHDLKIVENGVANCRIIRSASATSSVTELANRVSNLISSVTGISPEVTTDYVKTGETLDHSTLEILVGDTEYYESASALSDVPYGDYVVTRVDEKLVINSLSLNGLKAAITAFGKDVMLNGTKENYTVSADIRLTGTSIEIANALPLYQGGTPVLLHEECNDGQMVVIEETSEAEFDTYQTALTTAGYSLYTHNEMANNKFATYINDTYTVNVSYAAYETTTRIIIEPRGTLPILESENTYEKRVEASFAQLGVGFPVDGELAIAGMCYVAQASDGSFIIIDGGHKTDYCSKQLYDYMKKYAPDPDNIVIAAWIITHAHSDHVGAFSDFADKYADKVTLELFIANTPTDQAFIDGGIEGDCSGKNAMWTKAATCFKGAKLITAHVGHQYYLRDVKIEMLFTTEIYTPRLINYGNTTSMVFSVEIGGQKILILADTTNPACNVLSQMYGNYLKSDFVQTAHHGSNTGSKAYTGLVNVYKLASAPVVLWPCGEGIYPDHTQKDYNKALIGLDATKEIFVAGSRTVRFLFPYTVGTSGCKSILK